HLPITRPYAVFFCSSYGGNGQAGHNRGGIWRPQDWADLGKRVREMGLDIVVVGSEYDHTYYQQQVRPLTGKPWHDFIGKWGIGQTFAVIKNAKFVVSYQSGIGIVASYLGVPTAIFWRAKGNSISPDHYISFEEGMASAWTRPDMLAQGKHLPLIYGRHDVNYIVDNITQRGWAL
ncbi:MAG: glycosyltransferase family 9 protein, partial [Minisyncoccia bacterium]